MSGGCPRGVLRLSIVAAVLHVATAGVDGQQAGPSSIGTSLRTQADAAMLKQDYATARALLERWVAADPTDPRAWYDLTRLYAVDGAPDKALDAFSRAVDAGFQDVATADREPALAPIRSDPRYRAALARIAERIKRLEPDGYLRRFAPMQVQGTYIVMTPPDYATSGRDYPLCLILPGGGSTELGHGALADDLGRDGLIYAAVRAPYPAVDIMTVLRQPGYSARHPDAPAGDAAFTAQTRADYIAWIFTVAAAVEKEFRIRKGRVFIYGHSQGGQFGLLATLQHPDRVASLLVQAGSGAPAPIATAERLAALKQHGVPIWIVHGREDPTVPASNSTALADRLRAAGVATTLHIVPGGHAITDEMRAIGRRWLDEVARGGK